MLRIIHVANTLPVSYPVDPTAVFEPGAIGQLKVIGNDIVCGVSDGTCPFGILDDVKSTAFTAVSQDEIVIATNVVPTYDGYNLVVAADTDKALRWPSIVRSSFVCDVEGITLNDVNGIITIPEGTHLNYDADADGIYDAVKVICSYAYRIPNVIGSDSTLGSGRCTVWYQRGIFETDQYDTRQKYVVNAPLFVNSEGKLTSAQPSANHAGVAICTGPPSAIVSSLEFLWL